MSYARGLKSRVEWVDENTDESVPRWFGRIERMENNRIGKRVYVGSV